MVLIRPTSYWRQISPRGAIADFRTVFQQAGKNRWRFAVLAAIPTVAIFSVMWQEEAYVLPRPPEVTYITVWDPHRTEAEIVASNIANQRRKERLAAEQAKRDAEVREVYKAVGRATGIDVDAIEKKAEADRAAEVRAATTQSAPRPPAGE